MADNGWLGNLFGGYGGLLEGVTNNALSNQPWLGIPVALARKALQGAAPMAASGATLPGDVYAGNVDPNSQEAIARSMNLALSTQGAGGLLSSPVEGAVGAGVRSKLPAAGKWEQFAEEYPPVAPPVAKIDPKTGNEFFSKGTTPVIDAFRKDRAAIQKEIDAGNYDPYFPEAQRYDANPANFPAFEDTTSILRKTPDARAKFDAIAKDPAARAQLDKAFDWGMQRFNETGNWYHMGQLADAFEKTYGPELGPKMFKQKFADAMAATTGGADPTANLLMATYGNFLDQKGIPTPTAAPDMPFPIGGRFVTGNMQQYDKMIRQGQGVTPANPKRYNFSGAFTGNPNAMTIDEQMSAPWGLPMPPTGTYGHFQGALNRFAADKGVDPRGYQDVTWAGLKQAVGGPMIRHVNQAIARTSYLTGASPDEVVQEALIKSKRPIYSGGPGGLLGLLGLTQSQDK